MGCRLWENAHLSGATERALSDTIYAPGARRKPSTFLRFRAARPGRQADVNRLSWKSCGRARLCAADV